MGLYQGQNYINGNWVGGNSEWCSYSPSADQELIGKFPQSHKSDVEAAVIAARTVFPEWRDKSPIYRADLFDNLSQLIKRDENKLAVIISMETGKNLNESHAEVIESLHMCQVVAAMGRNPRGNIVASELATKDAKVIRKPKGVVAVISPWNFPLAIGSFWCAGPALVEGNTVVHKPSELTPQIAQVAAELYEEAGFPAGVFNLVHGDGSVGETLVHHDDVKCILFTGSAEVGQLIRQHCAEGYQKTCSCETGSKSAVIVFEDANFDLAVPAIVASATKLSGQRCVSAGRILIQRSIYRDMCNSITNAFKGLLPGDPFDDPAPPFGPLISKKQKQKVKQYNEMVRMDPDCEVRIYDNDIGIPKEGHFVAPLVYQCEWDNTKPYLVEEVFGPHVALIPFDSVQDGIDIYNDTPYGLACGVITEDFRIMRKCERECRAGMLYLNGTSVGAESHLPFGGVGKSGSGWKSAVGTVQAVTYEMAVTTNFQLGGIQHAQGLK